MSRTNFRVYSLAADEDGGCGFYRIREPARVAKDAGLDIEVHTDAPVFGTIDVNGHLTIERMDIQADVIIFQRPLLQSFYDLLIYCQKQGIACIVEIDDDLKAVHPDNVAYYAMHPDHNKVSNWTWMVKACEAADLVTCSTPALAKRYAPHGRYRVLRNRIPEVELKRPIVYGEHGPRLGWTGTVQTHPEDLDQIGVHMNAVLSSPGISDPNFYVVGDGASVRSKMYLPDHSEVVTTGWVPRSDYLRTMSDHIDVGVVPLKLDAFNEAKSALKSLEMASQGIPSVISPTSENILLSELTENPLASRGKEWQKHLKRLLLNEDFFLERSNFVRNAVSSYTYENHVDDWIDAWFTAIENRRSNS